MFAIVIEHHVHPLLCIFHALSFYFVLWSTYKDATEQQLIYHYCRTKTFFHFKLSFIDWTLILIRAQMIERLPNIFIKPSLSTDRKSVGSSFLESEMECLSFSKQMDFMSMDSTDCLQKATGYICEMCEFSTVCLTVM